MRKTAIGWITAGLLIHAGCGGDVKAELPGVFEGAELADSTSNYSLYVDAAKQMERNAAKYIGRTSWTPDQRDSIVSAARGPIQTIDGASNVVFGQTWANVFGPWPYTRGWRTMGRALEWRIDTAIKAGNHSDAIYCLVTSLKMANALASSNSQDADLGMEIASSCMDSIWPALPKFGAGELSNLSDAVFRQMAAEPPAKNILKQEKKCLYTSGAWIKESFQKRNFDTIADQLGKSVLPSVKYLRELAESKVEEQRAYFSGFQNAVDANLDLFRARLQTPPFEWLPEPRAKLQPWTRFLNSFGTPWRVYVEKRAAYRTRLRLLAIDAALLGRFKSSGAVPRSLDSFPKSLRMDPYSGRDLAYVSRGVDFKLYSVGEDKADDGGYEGDVGLGR
jgi:hypothetical protein